MQPGKTESAQDTEILGGVYSEQKNVWYSDKIK